MKARVDWVKRNFENIKILKLIACLIVTSDLFRRTKCVFRLKETGERQQMMTSCFRHKLALRLILFTRHFQDH